MRAQRYSTHISRRTSEMFNHSDTCVVPSVCNAVGLLILLKLCPVFTFLQQLMTKKIVSYLHIHLFSNVLHRRRRISPKRPMYLVIVGSHYCVMSFAYALHICPHNLIPFPCLYIEFFELVIEVIFHYCTTPPCHKIDLFKRPFWGSRSERLDHASVLLVSLIFLYPHKF